MKIIHRLKEYIDYKGISLNSFDKSIGVANGYIGKQIKNEASIGADIIEKIVSIYTDINLRWFITGKGEMLQSNVSTVYEPNVHYGNRKIPFVSISAVGGFGNAKFEIKETDVKEYYIVPKFRDRKIDFMIEVFGSSMQPKYNSGDVIACTIIRESRFIQWNKVHVISTKEQGILVKRLKQGSSPDNLLAISDNKDYDPFEIPVDEITGVAIVVGVIRLE
jgi:repressor LexA